MVLLAFMSFTSYSQSFQDFKKQIREDYTTFEKETQQKFNDFVTQIDAEFSDYLGENFEPYTTENQDYEPSGPKPDIIPQLEEIEISNSQMAFEIQQVGATY